VERFGMQGPVERWHSVREAIHREVCARGYDPELGAFTQAYGSRRLDAALLMLPLVGFVSPQDPRMIGTVRAIERELAQGGLLLRYRTDEGVDGLPPGEGVFLLCNFWLADNYALAGRDEEACALFERLLALRNDVGLLSEELAPSGRPMLGNFPQAFSHVGVINTAFNLTRRQPKPAHAREQT
jgi:GH15 family glucan-1,4-alpha-glucosidase